MKTTAIAGAFAIAFSTLASGAFAGHESLDGPMDLTTTGCKHNFTKNLVAYSNCFTGYEPYATGHYGSLACRDPYKGLRYVTVKTFWKGERQKLRCTRN